MILTTEKVLRPHPVTPLAADPLDLPERAARPHSDHWLLGRPSAVEQDVAEPQPVAGRECGDVVGGPRGHPELAAGPVDDDARPCGREVDLEVAGDVTHLVIVSLDGRQQRVPPSGSWVGRCRAGATCLLTSGPDFRRVLRAVSSNNRKASRSASNPTSQSTA